MSAIWSKGLVTATFLAFHSGCASVPQEAAQLSSDLRVMIRDTRESHFALIDEYMRQRRERLDEFMQRTWIPKYMQNFMKEATFTEQYDAEKNPAEKAKLVGEFQEQASKDIARQRAALVNALDEVERLIRKRISDHYDHILLVNETLTAHLLSAAKVTTARNDMMKKLNLPTNELVPLQKLDSTLRKIEQFEGKAENMNRLIDEAKSIVAQGAKNVQ